jgi:hypothetical protein
MGKKKPEKEEDILFSRHPKAGRPLPDAITSYNCSRTDFAAVMSAE